MKRVFPVIISICLGALAVAIGMGFFLKKANNDREHLAQLVLNAENDTKSAALAKDSAVKLANEKLDSANAEISKAQNIIKTLEEERNMLANADPLPIPSTSDLKGWSEAVNLPLSVSVKYPSADNLEVNDKTALTLTKNLPEKSGQVMNADNRWLSITPYEERLESELVGMFVTSTPVSYSVRGHLLIGYRGTVANSDLPHLVFHVRYDGQKTHLIWAREIDKIHNATAVQKALATLNFAK